MITPGKFIRVHYMYPGPCGCRLNKPFIDHSCRTGLAGSLRDRAVTQTRPPFNSQKTEEFEELCSSSGLAAASREAIQAA
jgi:hypothetical protein